MLRSLFLASRRERRCFCFPWCISHFCLLKSCFVCWSHAASHILPLFVKDFSCNSLTEVADVSQSHLISIPPVQITVKIGLTRCVRGRLSIGAWKLQSKETMTRSAKSVRNLKYNWIWIYLDTIYLSRTVIFQESTGSPAWLSFLNAPTSPK